MSKKDEKKKSFMDTVREVDKKNREAEEEKNRAEQEERRKREEKERKAYEEKLRRDRIELMKLKEGVISDEDIPKEEKVEKHYTFWEKLSNFIYHEKLALGFIALSLLLIGYVIYTVVTAKRPDMIAMYLDDDLGMQYICEDAAQVFAPYCEDLNGDGKIIVSMYYVPAEPDTSNSANAQITMAYGTQLAGEFQSGDVIMLIGTKKNFEYLGIINDHTLTNMSERYPGDKNAESFGYKLSGTKFKEQFGYEDLKDDLYAAFRNPKDLFGSSKEKMQRNYDLTLATFDRYLSENRAEE